MPTRDPVKNLEYVKKSQARKKEALGLIEYNRINAEQRKNIETKKKQQKEKQNIRKSRRNI